MGLIIFWAVLLVVCVIVELETVQLVSIWFALGAAGALISAAVAPRLDLWWLQLLIFLAISGTSLYFTRPLVRKHVKQAKRTATNADRVLAMIGVVRETVSGLENTGTVYVGNKLWTARPEPGGADIPVGANVDILRIEGVKLIVRPHEDKSVKVSDTGNI